MKRRLFRLIGCILALVILPSGTMLLAKLKTLRGFDVSDSLIPAGKILSGGVERDQIPAITDPKFLPLEKVDYLREEELVLSVTSGKVTRAYPIRILNFHEIVNDSIGDDHFVVTFCPLCGTGMVFDREIGKKVRTFGVSGLLYNSDVLLYDRESESLWSQLAAKSVAGPMAGTPLPWRVSEMMNWKAWKEKYPDGSVLSTETGYVRDYNSNPYSDYMRSSGTMFSVPTYRKDLAKKTWVFGVLVNGQAKAYEVGYMPHNEVLQDVVKGKKILIYFEPERMQFQAAFADSRKIIPSVMVYWFAWQSFHPDTEVWGKVKNGKKK